MEHMAPGPGDAVRLTRNWNGVSSGRIAVLDGLIGEARSDYLAVFAYSVFRGRDHSGPEQVSCSGGPCPMIQASELRATGETIRLPVWRWKDDWPLAGNSEQYLVEVSVWEWDGPTGSGGGN